MKLNFMNMSFLFVLTSLVGSVSFADRDDVKGRSTLSIRLDRGAGGMYEVDVRDEGDKVVGRNTLSNMQLINLEKIPGGYSGVADGTSVRVTCEEMKCTGSIGGGSVNVELTPTSTVSSNPLVTGYKYRGGVNFVSISATQSASEVSVRADASFSAKGRDGKYSGRGAGRGMNSSFRATLKTSGTLMNGGDPALFILTIIAPMVRNNL